MPDVILLVEPDPADLRSGSEHDTEGDNQGAPPRLAPGLRVLIQHIKIYSPLTLRGVIKSEIEKHEK